MESESSQCGPQEHPGSIPARYRDASPFARAIEALRPNGNRREIRALFGNRVGWSAIHLWLSGARKPPQWAVDCLHDRVAPVFQVEPAARRGAGLMAWMARHGRPRGGKRAKEKPAD